MGTANRWIYVVLAFVVASWGLNIVMVKYLTETAPPFLVAAVRMPLAGLALLPFVLRKYGWYRPSRKQWGLLCLIGLTSIFFHQLFLASGVVTTTATNASLILGLNPLTTALLAAVFVGEKMNARLALGIAAGFSGVVIVVLSGSADASVEVSGWGDLIMVLSMLGYVAGGLLIKTIASTGMPTLVTTAYSTLIGGILLNIGAFAQLGPGAYGLVHFDGTGWLVMLASAWIASSLGTLGWNHGIKLLGANKTAMFINGMPFASMVGAVLFLGEHIRWIHVLAFVLTTLGIVIGTYQPRGFAPRKPPAAAGSGKLNG
ncbi:DMT family transporter [Paenibacillus doosanensis]|uniref:O-acetylserine/cysteine export protein n=1 Tax=Paenibacillus konkukensis TaxID=2020716 RepID=A0ABY4RPW0_9BACL|nr:MULTISPECIES: DMT family transporter [Paenibacillus]MCS7459084.1 DMT family transporter [Paenibacillus doosanensis]UQZ84138.1 O-acetylserine/cysteine export protein [Paenibacillus konkukensis]